MTDKRLEESARTDKGASAVHRLMREELQNYIGSQYFGKTPLFFDAAKDKLRTKAFFTRAVYRSTPAYKRVANGFETLATSDWTKRFFIELARRKTAVFESPFAQDLTAGDDRTFAFLTGEREAPNVAESADFDLGRVVIIWHFPCATVVKERKI